MSLNQLLHLLGRPSVLLRLGEGPLELFDQRGFLVAGPGLRPGVAQRVAGQRQQLVAEDTAEIADDREWGSVCYRVDTELMPNL
jgi:hypothetical protein